MKRNDLTDDPKHYDYIWYYSELDKKYSQLQLHKLDTKTRKKIAKKQVEGSDGKPHNVWLEVCTKIYCAFDIETSTVHGVNIADGKEGYYSAMYIAMFGINNHCVLFRTWNEVYKFFIQLPRLLKLTPCSVLMVWIHNLDYENSYIKHRFDIDGSTYFGKSKQHPIKYLLQQHFYIHDSFSITNSSLKKLGEMYGTKHKKAAGDLDHNVKRNSKTELSYKELGYCCNDVFVLCDFAKIMFDEFLEKKGYIPDTSTQILSKELQDNVVTYGKEFLGKRYDKIIKQYDEKMHKQQILKSIHGKIFGFEYMIGAAVQKVEGIVDSKMFTPFDENENQIPPWGKEIYGKTYYDFYEWLFRGGFTKSNARYTSTDITRIYGVEKEVAGYDFTSSYPFVQSVCNFPIDKFKEIELTEKKLMNLKLEYGADDFEKFRYIFILEFYDLDSTNDFALESQSKSIIEGRKVIDNGRIQYAEKVTVCLTDCDFALYKLYYKWDKIRILKCWKAKAGKLPDYLLYTLWNNGLKKQTLKNVKGMEIEYLLSKMRFNALFGLCCRKPIYTEYKLSNEVLATGYTTTESVSFKYFGRKDIITHNLYNNTEETYDLDQDECKISDFDSATIRSILSPFWGIWTSAFARYNLLYNVKRVSDESEWITNDVLYCDTDSMYMINYQDHKHIIDEWNDFARNRIENCIPDEYAPLKKLGQFTNIAEEDSDGLTDHFYNFKTLGAKRYLKTYHTTRTSKSKRIKSIIPKTSVTVAGLPKGTLEKFCKKYDLNIFEEFKDGMNFTINDVPELVKIARTYHDELVKINIDGEIMTEYSSCTLYPNTFKLTMLDIYKMFVNNILESSGGKAYAKGVIENG